MNLGEGSFMNSLICFIPGNPSNHLVIRTHVVIDPFLLASATPQKCSGPVMTMSDHSRANTSLSLPEYPGLDNLVFHAQFVKEAQPAPCQSWAYLEVTKRLYCRLTVGKIDDGLVCNLSPKFFSYIVFYGSYSLLEHCCILPEAEQDVHPCFEPIDVGSSPSWVFETSIYLVRPDFTSRPFLNSSLLNIEVLEFLVKLYWGTV